MPDKQKPSFTTSFDEEALRQRLREAQAQPATPERIARMKKICGRDTWSLRYALIALELGDEAALKAAHEDALNNGD